MNSETPQAIGLIMVAAIMNASYILPMKLNRKWKWENSWFAFSIVGLAIVPTIITVVTVPQLWSIYGVIPAETLAAMAFFGAGWGVSMVLFGLAVNSVGLAITFAVSLGVSSASGALVPLISQHPDKLMSREGILIMASVIIIFAGVAVCGLAGKYRDSASQSTTPSDQDKLGADRGRYLRGFLFAFTAGFLGSMLNYGLAFGGSIQQAALDQGASEAMMSNAVWLPCLYAGFIPGVIYCFILMRKRRSLANLGASGTWHYWALAGSMGLLWYGSIILYSIATLKLGTLGVSIGWPLFLSAIVIASTALAVLIGEWTQAGRKPLRIMILGVGCLVFAIGVLSQATR